jgi:hypothetical protein
VAGPEDTVRLLTEIRDLIRDISSTQKVDSDQRSRVQRKLQRLLLYLLVFLGLYVAYLVWWYARYGLARRA